MTTPHKLVNGKQVPLTEAEIAAMDADAAAHQAKVDRRSEIKPLKDFYQARKDAYATKLGATAYEQIGAILEAGSLSGLKALYDEIRTIDHPWTPELLALKDGCSEDELKACRGD